MEKDRDFADAFDAAFAALRRQVEAVCAAEAGWPDRAAAAIAAALDFAAAQPGSARLLTSDAFAQGLYGALRHRQMIAHFADLLAEGRRESSDGGVQLPTVTEKALIGGFAEIVAERLRTGAEATLPGLAGELVELVLTPYLGVDDARQVALRARPRA
jgi:hypothetical protein